uniref:Reverse transcriptase zinc-binding domain-containing protein n=1 Tax=Davidia involucrata TaxID=16924 RepID=A0A5B7BN90_DAVIN
MDNLKRRGFVLASRCIMCEKEEETSNHLFLHCDVARVLWNVLFSLGGCQWVMPRTVRELSCWKKGSKHRPLAKAWKMVPFCLFWCIWGERNNRTFEGNVLSLYSLKDRFLRLLYFGL